MEEYISFVSDFTVINLLIILNIAVISFFVFTAYSAWCDYWKG